VFDFACDASMRLKNGREHEKKTIFCTPSQNRQLIDQKLYISKVKWLERLKGIQKLNP